jgi:hypothetical protein
VYERATRWFLRDVDHARRTTDGLIREAIDSALNGSHPVTLHAKMLRLELLKVKADLERGLGSSCSTARPAAGRSTGSRRGRRDADVRRQGSTHCFGPPEPVPSQPSTEATSAVPARITPGQGDPSRSPTRDPAS